MYIISKGNVGRRLDELLTLRRQGLGDLEAPQKPPRGEEPSRELAITKNGNLRAGELYASSQRDDVSFYLPTYAFAETGGRYSVGLKFLEPTGAAPEGGAIGELSVELERRAPPAPAGRTIIELEHTATAIVRYRVPSESGAGAAPMSVPVGPLSPLTRGTSRTVLPIYTKADFDRWFEIMTRPELGASLDIECEARVGHRTAMQIRPFKPKAPFMGQIPKFITPLPIEELPVVVEPPVAPDAPFEVEPTPIATTRRLKRRFQLDRELATPLRTTPFHLMMAPTASVAHHAVAHTAVASPHTAVASPHIAEPAAAAVLRVKPLHLGAIKPQLEVAAEPKPSIGMILGKQAMVAAKPKVGALKASFDTSDVMLSLGAKKRKALLAGVVLDEDGQPELVEVTGRGVQSLGFWFNSATNAYIFELGSLGVPSSTTVLLQRPVGEVMFYQLSTDPNLYFYEPQEFRIPRTEAFPHRPDLIVALGEAAVEDDEGALAMTYQATLAFRLVPWINPASLEQGIQVLAQGNEAAFVAPLQPAAIRFELDVPRAQDDGAVRMNTEVRTTAKFDPDGSIRDSLLLSAPELDAVATAFLNAPSAVGVQGRVVADYAGRGNRVIPARLSLAVTAGRTVDASWLGSSEAPSTHLVRLRNALESPVRIDAAPPVPLGSGALATPIDLPPNLELSPGQVHTLRYKVSPDNVALDSLHPIVHATILPVLRTLWPMLLVSEGYTSRTFTVDVSIDPGYFGVAPAPGVEPLSGVYVEFDPPASVTLSPDDLDARVDVPYAFLPKLLGEPDADRYSYRVTNVHPTGEGARTNWIEVRGGGSLVIEPAPLPG